MINAKRIIKKCNEGKINAESIIIFHELLCHFDDSFQLL